MTLSLSRLCKLRIVIGSMLLALFAATGFSQSSDVRFPTAINGSEVMGMVPARDIGDARLTDHFYTFSGLPGDLLITIESKNLNGDFDVFSATDLRPLVKLVVYAESAGTVTKNIYLRKPESLILRVEGRTPNDDEGTYRIRFSGSFAALDNRSGAGDTGNSVESLTTSARTGDRKTSRVSSSGARIEEPVAAMPTPEPTVATPTEEATTKTTTAPTNTRGRRPAAPGKTSPKSPAPVASGKTSTVTRPVKNIPNTVEPKQPASEAEEVEKTAVPVKERPAPRRVQPGNARGSARAAKPEATAENGRLIIEVKGGSRLEYLMSTVSRVTVENGEVVIVSDDGYTKRIPLTNILRMSIAP